jgi:hypothetical protein
MWSNRGNSIYSKVEITRGVTQVPQKDSSGALFSLNQRRKKDCEGNIILWLRKFVGGKRFCTTKEQNQVMGYRN